MYLMRYENREMNVPNTDILIVRRIAVRHDPFPVDIFQRYVNVSVRTIYSASRSFEWGAV